jgi:hypothetical protein
MLEMRMSSPDVVTGPAVAFSPLPAIAAPVVYAACGAALLIAVTLLVSLSNEQQRAADVDIAPPPSFEQLAFMP